MASSTHLANSPRMRQTCHTPRKETCAPNAESLAGAATTREKLASIQATTRENDLRGPQVRTAPSTGHDRQRSRSDEGSADDRERLTRPTETAHSAWTLVG